VVPCAETYLMSAVRRINPTLVRSPFSCLAGAMRMISSVEAQQKLAGEG
jgi:hypothetical protein